VRYSLVNRLLIVNEIAVSAVEFALYPRYRECIESSAKAIGRLPGEAMKLMSTKMQAAFQVAAVCYRRATHSIEFLLVNTSSGKWTFPKGRLCPYLTPSDAAAREALEEAGVRGRIEKTSFARYVDVKRALGHVNTNVSDAEKPKVREILINAYLLNVHSVSDPHEPNRNPTWFSLEEARQKLSEQRAPEYALEIAGVVDAAWRTVRRAEKKLLARAQSRSRRLVAAR
jgi:8-oxo-dGTP pyrophosphatase MutT (NUDIX family)